MAGDYSWLDPALHSQTTDNMHAANDARVPAPYPYNMNAADHVTIPLPSPDNMEPTHHASIPTTASYNMEPINQASAPPSGLNKMETANEDKAPPPDYSQVFDPAKLSELWAAYQNKELNLLGAMNACQAHYDATTFWDRDNKNGYINHQIDDPQACFTARQNSMNNIEVNNKMYLDMNEFNADQQKAFDKLYSYLSTKFSKETIHGAYRQTAAKRGAANRRTNTKRHEAVVVGMIEELFALRDYFGVLDDKYKQRFDRLAKEVVAATKVKMTSEITAKLASGAIPGAQG
ncbi:hypothetical protein E4T52_03557 [Aureobasidium sp. EXF-3400]|nr:hypothetical protein E4T51_02684 [Aureobasidium sp. EXF-12344]KAI4781518.1 hypothetical protein E4T52_03557 [Aureobasidium sp. EXF-3400]